MTVLYEEKSQRTRSAELLVVFFVILLLCAAAYTTYRSIQLHTVLLAEYFIEIMAIIVMVKQAVSRIHKRPNRARVRGRTFSIFIAVFNICQQLTFKLEHPINHVIIYFKMTISKDRVLFNHKL